MSSSAWCIYPQTLLSPVSLTFNLHLLDCNQECLKGVSNGRIIVLHQFCVPGVYYLWFYSAKVVRNLCSLCIYQLFYSYCWVRKISTKVVDLTAIASSLVQSKGSFGKPLKPPLCNYKLTNPVSIVGNFNLPDIIKFGQLFPVLINF